MDRSTAPGLVNFIPMGETVLGGGLMEVCKTMQDVEKIDTENLFSLLLSSWNLAGGGEESGKEGASEDSGQRKSIIPHSLLSPVLGSNETCPQ